MFKLHSQLEQDCIQLGQLELCLVLLMNDSRFPWLILVPKRVWIREIYELEVQDQIQLIKESSFVAEKLAHFYKADKLNIAAIGNKVEQLHLHHVVRFKDDLAWSSPVWGFGQAIPYEKQEVKELTAQLSKILNL
jgi:diadenosine tetraphosphate (Ap4A) HIT family hydrolase